jgi:uncharacterized protein (UPF0218 family)
LIEWEAKEALFNNQKKDYIEAMSTEITGDTTIVTPNELPAKPVQLRFTVGDITSQKLIRHCSIRPEGALCDNSLPMFDFAIFCSYRCANTIKTAP